MYFKCQNKRKGIIVFKNILKLSNKYSYLLFSIVQSHSMFVICCYIYVLLEWKTNISPL